MSEHCFALGLGDKLPPRDIVRAIKEVAAWHGLVYSTTPGPHRHGDTRWQLSGPNMGRFADQDTEDAVEVALNANPAFAAWRKAVS